MFNLLQYFQTSVVDCLYQETFGDCTDLQLSLRSYRVCFGCRKVVRSTDIPSYISVIQLRLRYFLPFLQASFAEFLYLCAETESREHDFYETSRCERKFQIGQIRDALLRQLDRQELRSGLGVMQFVQDVVFPRLEGYSKP